MPMFYTPKPRQFHYEPRFYDPKKEEWEAKKRKYAAEKYMAEQGKPSEDADVAYFERRLKELDEKEKRQRQRLGVKDLFRKREMPKFNPQFHPTESVDTTSTAHHKIKFRRRFDVEDPDSFKPAPAGKIIMYVGLVFLLLYWIFN